MLNSVSDTWCVGRRCCTPCSGRSIQYDTVPHDLFVLVSECMMVLWQLESRELKNVSLMCTRRIIASWSNRNCLADAHTLYVLRDVFMFLDNIVVVSAVVRHCSVRMWTVSESSRSVSCFIYLSFPPKNHLPERVTRHARNGGLICIPICLSSASKSFLKCSQISILELATCCTLLQKAQRFAVWFSWMKSYIGRREGNGAKQEQICTSTDWEPQSGYWTEQT